ncbi:MAG TPA: amylo-alpha-1,6-glucosidase [Chthoniobacteraceae bacterium]|jgi:hypothetical protein|nr:amylo-alpha-1,6-glucosidase [Chthoniobacteraceae bacterium]
MKYIQYLVACSTLCTGAHGAAFAPPEGVTISLAHEGDLRGYTLTTAAPLRDNQPPDKRVTVSETAGHASIRTGNLLFDGLYAMAASEALADSVSQISDGSYGRGVPIRIEGFQTGEYWKYIWTRDLSYSVYLALGSFDPARAVNSLLFKTSALKTGGNPQIIQDTGSGGSYPVSADRVCWALGACQVLNYLGPKEREHYLKTIYPILRDTIEQDRALTYDPQDGLYRGEQSFLDWREQTYPAWTKDDVLPIAVSKTVSVNALNYHILRCTMRFAASLGQKEDAGRYGKWAADLRDAINTHFYDANVGLYSTCLFSGGEGNPVQVARYDLLGEALAILTGVATPRQAASVIAHYPVGPYGPPVVWPQEKDQPIYHNQAVWPFATAFWIKAARQAGNPAAVDAGVASMANLAARNLSNMENADFVTGGTMVRGAARNGPVVDSRRQLWSVAGYLSMVQDIVFGLDADANGLRFHPFITAAMRNGLFAGATTLEMRGFNYQGTVNDIRIHLPPVDSFKQGVCRIGQAEVNGQPAGDGFTMPAKASNQWDIYLEAPSEAAPQLIRTVDPTDAIFAPAAPQWNGITLQNGRLVLSYRGDADAAFNIYRDGRLCAGNLRQTIWTDPLSDDYQSTVHTYAVAAVDPATGNVSHLTPGRTYRTPDQQQVITVGSMRSRGGNIVNGHHFENWGNAGDEIFASCAPLKLAGRYLIRVEFANGAGPVNTGITCAVKRLDVIDSKNRTVATGYLVMPQSGDWYHWELSSPVSAVLNAGESYSVRIDEDSRCINMSYLQNNARYTGGNGGGAAPYNYVNISAIRFLYVGDINSGSHLAGK